MATKERNECGVAQKFSYLQYELRFLKNLGDSEHILPRLTQQRHHRLYYREGYRGTEAGSVHFWLQIVPVPRVPFSINVRKATSHGWPGRLRGIRDCGPIGLAKSDGALLMRPRELLPQCRSPAPSGCYQRFRQFPRPPAAAPTLQDIDSLRAELESMKTLVAGFTKKTRKRKSCQSKQEQGPTNDSDAENDAPPQTSPRHRRRLRIKTSPPTAHHRSLPRPYTVIEDVITHGLKVDTALEGDEHEEGQDESPLRCWKNYKNLELIQSVCREMNKGMEGARSDATGTLKQRILSLLDENPQPGAKVVVNTEVSKATRAKDPKVAPSSCRWSTMGFPTHGNQCLRRPRPQQSTVTNFLFPFGQLDDVSALETILTGPVMLRSAKAISRDCGVGCQTIALYNRVVLGHSSGLAPLAPTVTANAPPPLTHLERLQAARAAQATANSE
ncbi:hypothetical protein B0H13DRAFT_1852309 [Mycena leptocephala]|nr:hypothetical protein B0H13DRAFT_1852309 [Mycena leptocephala]